MSDVSTVINISEDKDLLDKNMIYKFLTERSTWAKNIDRDTVEKSIENSLCFGAYIEENGEQIGFSRVITDYATFANLVDVFILEKYRGNKISNLLMECIINHRDLIKVRRFTLVTSTSEWLYEKFGFTKLHAPQNHMEILRANIYDRQK